MHIYCSMTCKFKVKDEKKGLTCRICGLPMRPNARSKPQGRAAHYRCSSPAHGTAYRFRKGCRCGECRAAQILHESVHGRRGWITRQARYEIYDRDEFTCQICFEPVDMELEFPDPKSHSLDHIIPRKHGGVDDAWNLRMAHMGCNSSRGAPADGWIVASGDSTETL